ncbi:MAG: hypothetical protein FJ279_38515, partial [Planctomycetes bacterium]|nr:hypothetical protein [Planctomycetota bacterium]
HVAPPWPSQVQRVSVASDAAQATAASWNPAISADGRFVAFTSSAPNLVSNDTNNRTDVFVYDRQNGTVERVSVASDGTEGNGHSTDVFSTVGPGVSADGRYVAFMSFASNLVAGDTNSAADVFVHDRQTHTTERVSVASDGAQANGNSLALTYADQHPSISPDGRYVAFSSEAANLVAGDSGFVDVFVHDRQTHTTERVSVNGLGVQGNSDSYDAQVSADGRLVAFTSYANNLVDGDTNFVRDVFVRDRQTGQTQRVSVDSSGNQGMGTSVRPSLSPDGGFVAFTSNALNFTQPVAGVYRAYVYDRTTAVLEMVSPTYDGNAGVGVVEAVDLSDDGRYVAFTADGGNLVPGDTNGRRDVFWYDRVTRHLRRLAAETLDPNGDAHRLALSADGLVLAFDSLASNLVANDTNAVSDIFVVSAPSGLAGPRVTGLSPAPGSTRANVAAVVATFNEDLAPGAVSAATYKLFSGKGANGQWGGGDDVEVAGTVAYDVDTDRATFTPSAALTLGEYAV